jgi:predicted RNA-binding Zn-ribbon protein involved in translation (DUF1610 family)
MKHTKHIVIYFHAYACFMTNAVAILNGKSTALRQAFIEKARYSIVFGLLGTICILSQDIAKKCVRLHHYCLQTLATIYACPHCTVQSIWAVFRNAICRLHSVLSIVAVGRILTWWLKISQPTLLKTLTMKLISKGLLQCWNLNIRHDILFYSVITSGDFIISHLRWVYL